MKYNKWNGNQQTNEKKQIAHSFNIPGNCLSVFVMDSRLPLPFCHFVMSLVLHIILRLLGAFGRKRSFVLLYIFFLFNFQSLWLGIGIYLHSIRQSRRKNVRCWEITLFEMQPQRRTQQKNRTITNHLAFDCCSPFNLARYFSSRLKPISPDWELLLLLPHNALHTFSV